MPPDPAAQPVAVDLQTAQRPVFAGSIWRSRTLWAGSALLVVALLAWALMMFLGFDPSPVGKALHVIVHSGAHGKP